MVPRRSALLIVLSVATVLIGVLAGAALSRRSVGGVALVYPISRTSEINVDL